MLALSYRGYWTSNGRASEAGLVLDAEAILAHAARTYPPSAHTRFVLYGHSLGASVALTAAANAHSIPPPPISSPTSSIPPSPPIHGLILETPFLSVRAMLATMYPQKWLPYHYLSPFLRNHWDGPAALRRLVARPSRPLPLSPPSGASSRPSSPPSNPSSPPAILILQAGRDELVPPHHAHELESLCLELGYCTPSSSSLSNSSISSNGSVPSVLPERRTVRLVSIANALHTDVLSAASGRRAVVDFLVRFGA
ncbi:Alpha/beta hydrolase domain-containing protein 13 [Pseudocyphellaria aurata]|nr:Alpha/beta hydrolase domain-containing protein 13 [Pseudocyphellaria aurata]